MRTDQTPSGIKAKLKNVADLQAALAKLQEAANTKDRLVATQGVTNVLKAIGSLRSITIQEARNGKLDDDQDMPAPAAEKTPTSAIVDRTGMVELAGTSQRQTANNKAVELLATIKEQGLTRDDLSAEQIAALAAYTGSGGGLISNKGKHGSAYEYYTPKVVASKMWELASEMGFTGGKVLDPSAGTGIFAATSPENAVIDSIELDEVSGSIASILNDGDRSNTVVSSFEKRNELIADDSLDMVMTNVPFGDNATRGEHKMDDDAYQNESLETYFILRSLEKVKHGGLAVFITPTSVISGKKGDKERLRKLTSLKAELMGVYRLPNKVFEQTGADVMTDIVVYRKHSREATDQINALYEAGDMDTLAKTKVMWDEYISGAYFKDASRKAKFMLGEERQVPSRFNPEMMVTELFTTKPTADVMKMIKKFEGSRIDWEALGAAEAAYIEYNNGDVVFQNGKQLEYQDGRWHVMAKQATDSDREMQVALADMGSAIEMVVAGMTFDMMDRVNSYSLTTGQADLIPRAARFLFNRTLVVAPAMRAAAWNCVIAAQAIKDVIAERDYGYDFMTNEPALTKFMKTAFLDGKNTKLTKEPKQDFNFVKLYYASGKYNAVWRGEVDTEVEVKDEARSYTSLIARMQYDNKSLYLSREQLAKVNPDADPLTDSEWFINHDGSQVIAANDFLTGSLTNCLAKIDDQIKQATDSKIIAKLEQQKLFAIESVTRINLQNVDFDLRSPLISAEDKVRFLKQSVHKDAYVSFDEYGKGTPDIAVKGGDLRDEEKLYNRIGDWLAKGTVTTGGVTLSRMTEREALDWMSEQINVANVKFSNWVKANDKLMASLERTMNHNDNLFFSQNSDESPVEIAGMNPQLSLHGYQNAFVRSQGRHFGGINGMGVGLGKTFSSLASTQHAQNIGAKKKTIFVVPNSVLSNWRKEVDFAYTSTDDCLFVGLRENGDQFRVYSNKYDEDLLKAVDSKYRKIFMTYEAFKRIKLKDDTIADYARYVKQNDSAYANKDLQKADEKAKGMIAELIDRLSMDTNAPFLEDMRVDSVVIDEAHAFKNSISAPNTDNRIKYLSQPQESARGEDAQAKLFYIRGLTPANDGVQLLTATPITNSPLEIYSMLSLAGGRDTVNKMCGGIVGADDFLAVMCQIEEEVVPTIDGKTRSQNVFTGIRNAQILKKAVRANAVIKDAQDVGMSVVIPDREELATSVNLGKEIDGQLKELQDAYVVARQIEAEKLDNELKDPTHPQSPYNPKSPYSIVAGKYGETNDLIAHPFNLIRKMDVMIADAEFSDGVTFYDFDKDQQAIAEKVVNQFSNGKKKHTDERSRPSSYTADEDAKPIYKKEDGEQVLKGYKIACKARIVIHKGRPRIMIDTIESKFQSSFEAMADKAKLNLDVTVSAKVAAMLENFKNEQANPRGINSDNTTSKIVKQIIFCDHLFLHNKIKRILAKRAGVPANKIAIITGQTNNEPDQMIDIQDGFNAFGADNQYQVIIANKKAEVGINLQRGTQAIHHLTTGWTPDSLEQRNGRGARQGNKTERVKIFHYDADGTFDEFKRTMIDKKDEWITSVLSDEDTNTIEVSGSITRAEQDALIRLGGDREAMRAYQADRDAQEVQARKDAAIKRHKVNMQVVDEQTKIVKNLKIDDFYENAVKEVVNLIKDNNVVYKKIHADKSSASTKANSTKLYNTTRSVILDKIEEIFDNVKSQAVDGNWKVIEGIDLYRATISAEDAYDIVQNNLGRGENFANDNSGSWAVHFARKVLRHGANFGNGKTIVNSDGIYQATYDEINTTARNLIKQALLAANELADRAGLAGMTIPDDAGNLIADGKAVIHDGFFFMAGSIAISDQWSPVRKEDFLFAINDKLRGHALTSRVDTRGVTVYQSPESSPQGIKAKAVIHPNTPEYLKYVKAMAKIEDEHYSAGQLNEAVYSNAIPQVAEYRDSSIQPLWHLSPNLAGRQVGLSNCDFLVMLPYEVLSAGTPFANKALRGYSAAGISIDLDSKTYQVTNGKTQINADQYDTQMIHDLYYSYVGLMIKHSGVKLTADDKALMGQPQIIAELSKEPADQLITALRAAADSITERQSDRVLEDMVVKLFDDLIYSDEYMSDEPTTDMKIYTLEYVYDEHLNRQNILDAVDFLRTESSKNIAEAKVKAMGLEASAAGIKDSDTVYVSGDTQTYYKTIKAYGNKNGEKAKYQGNKHQSWAMSFRAYKEMITARPELANLLPMSKTR